MNNITWINLNEMEEYDPFGRGVGWVGNFFIWVSQPFCDFIYWGFTTCQDNSTNF